MGFEHHWSMQCNSWPRYECPKSPFLTLEHLLQSPSASVDSGDDSNTHSSWSTDDLGFVVGNLRLMECQMTPSSLQNWFTMHSSLHSCMRYFSSMCIEGHGGFICGIDSVAHGMKKPRNGSSPKDSISRCKNRGNVPGHGVGKGAQRINSFARPGKGSGRR